MDLPPDINTDDENFFMPELPPDVDTDSEFFDAVCTSCGCHCSRNCRSCFDAVAIAELRGRSEGMSEEENVQRRWDLVRSACTDADGEVKFSPSFHTMSKERRYPSPVTLNVHAKCTRISGSLPLSFLKYVWKGASSYAGPKGVLNRYMHFAAQFLK